jgi:heme-degrading monooxygenase HmoA
MAMEERPMAVGFIISFPGGTQEQYDTVLEQLNLGGRMAPGGIFHAAGPTEEGWRVVDVWESQEAFDTFLHERLYQAMQNAGMSRPQVETWPVYSVLEPAVP